MDEIIDYVVETPQDTNPNILRSMLNNLSPGGGGTTWLIVNGYEQHDMETGEYSYVTDFDTAEPIVRAMPFVCFVFHFYDPETGDPVPLNYDWPVTFDYVDDESPVSIGVS